MKEVRERRGLSQRRLAEKVGVSQAAIVSYEKGEKRPPGDVLCDIADELGVDVGYLLERQDQERLENRLPPAWVQAVGVAIELGFSPDQVKSILRAVAQSRPGGDEAQGPPA